jgi:hypothetical protein
MKTFEEKFTACLDGLLSGEELRSLETECPSLQQEKTDFLKLKSLLKESLPPRELESPEFFNFQLMERIKREAKAAGRSCRPSLFGLPRLAWGGIGALAIGFALFFAMIPRGDFSDPRAKYVAEVLKTRTANPKVKATVENQKDMTIIKLDGLDKLPSGQELRR